MRVSMQKFTLFSVFLFLLIVQYAYAQPAWFAGYPQLRQEARSVGLRVRLDQPATVYYIIYRSGSTYPASGSLTDAQIRNPGTAPAGMVTSGSITFADGSYCAVPPPSCLNIVGDVSRERVVSISLNGFTPQDFRVFFTAQVGAGPLTAPQDRSITIGAINIRCFRVGETSVVPDKFIGLSAVNICSPSDVFLTIRYTGVDYNPTTPVQANVNFGGSGTTGTLFTLALQPSIIGTPELNKAFRRYEAAIPKTYNYSIDNPALNPTGSACTFKIDADLGNCRLSGAATDLTTTHTVWDDPGTVRGQQNVNPDGPDATDEEFEVCEGNRTPVNLVDASEFNCTVVEEARQIVPLPASPNYEARWVQWVYGVAGTNVTTGAAATEKVTINGVNFDLSDFPIYGPVEYLASPVTDPWSTAYPIQMPSSATLGQRFIVQLRSWNTCRQYDNNTGDGNGLNPSGGINVLGPVANNKWFTAAGLFNQPGGGTAFPNAIEAPVTLNKDIVIIDAPPAPVVPDREICSGDSRTLTVTAPLGGGFFYRWFSNATLTTQVGTGSTFTPSNAQAPAGQVSHFWVTVESTGPGNCVSPPSEVRLFRRPALTTPTPISGSVNLCPNSTYTFSVPSAPPTITLTDPTPDPDVTRTTTHQWTVPGTWTITSGQGTESITITTGATTGAGTVSVVNQYSVAPTCAATATTLAINVRDRPTVNISPDPALICEGSTVLLNGTPMLPPAGGGFTPVVSAHTWTGNTGILNATNIQQPTVQASTTSGTYNLSYQVTTDFGGGVFCTSTVDNSVVMVSANPALANAGPDQTQCFPVGPLVVTLAGSNPGVGTGTWTKQSGLGTVTFANANAPGTTATVSLNGIYVLRWTVINGACSSFDEVQIDYGTAPATPTAGIDQDVCGVTTTLNGSTPTFETGTWSQVSGPGTTTFAPNANTRNATATASLAGTYVYRWRYTSGTCSATQDDVQVIFRTPPTVAGPVDFTSCLNSPQTAAFDVNLSGTFGGGSGSARWVVVTGSGTFSSSTTATGNFDASSPATDIYRPSATDFTNGSVVLRLESDDPTGACTSVNDPVTITFDRLPTANAGLDQSICTSSTTLAATAANFGGTGTWTFPGGVVVSNINLATATASSLPDATATTLRWTVTSALGVCAPVFDEVVITRNALPGLIDAGLAATPLCEDAPAGGLVEASVTPAYLTSFNDNVTGIIGSTNRSVEFFVNAGLTIPYTATAAYQNNQTVHVRVRRTDVTPQCERVGTFTVRVNPKPITVNLDGTPAPDLGLIQFCADDFLNPTRASAVNLTVFNSQFNATPGLLYTWHSGLVDAQNDVNALPANSITVNDGDTYVVRVENSVTGCFNTADVEAKINPLPSPNAIVGSASRCIGDQGFYFVTPAADKDYQWTIPGVFTNVGGVTNTFNVFLEFPGVVSPGQNIILVESQRFATGYTNIPSLYTASGNLLCAGDPNTFTIQVDATPAPVVISGDFSLCENEVSTYEALPSNAPISTYDWVINPPTAASIIVIPNSNKAQVTASTTNFQLEVREVSASCTGPNATQLISVNARPSLSITPAIICSDDLSSGITLSGPSATTFNITNVNVPPGLNPPARATVVGGAPAVLFNDTFTNLTGGNIIVGYTVEPVSAAGCVGTAGLIQLTVRPEPILQAGLFDEICSTFDAINIVMGLSSGSSPADQYVVESINNGGLSAVAGAPAVGTFTTTTFLLDDKWENKTAAPVDVIYLIKPRNSATTCIGDPAVPVTVRVKPEPVVTPLPVNTICSGNSPNLVLAATPAVGNNFSWTVGPIVGFITGATNGAGSTSIPNVLDNNTGVAGSVTYAVTASLNSCFSQPQNIVVSINPAPVANPINDILCSDNAGGSSSIQNLTSLQPTINNGGGISFSWFEDLALTVPIVAPGSFTLVNGDPVFARVDNGQCTKIATVSYTINPRPSVSSVKSLFYNTFDVSCFGSANGQLTATAANGTAPYLFSIDAGASFFTSNVFNGLSTAGGPYVVRVRDINNCIADASPLSIINPPVLSAALAKTLSYNGADVSCQFATDGQITVTPAGGTGFGYSYSILELPGNVSGNTDAVYDGLGAGTHTVVVRDANNCQITTASIILTQPTAILPTATLTSAVTCNGLNDGIMTVTATGGTELGNYQFTLQQAPGTNNFTGVMSNLGAGSYTVLVRDDNNCTAISSPVNITQPSALTAFASITSNYSGSKISCFGANDAILTTTPNGGNGSYAFELVQVPANLTGQVDGSFENLGPNDYSVKVTDALGCTVTTLLVNVNEPSPVTVTSFITNDISCFGNSDGEITISASGGTGAFTFERLPGVVNATGIFPGLAQNTYNFSVRDLNNCTATTSRILSQPSQLVASAAVSSNFNGSQVSCNGSQDGVISVTASGGTGALTYVFDNFPLANVSGQFNGVFSNIGAGVNYTFTVKDTKNCTVSTAPIVIIQPSAVTVTRSILSNFNGSPISCFGANDGQVRFIASGGTTVPLGTYFYQLDQDPSNISGNSSGIYSSLVAGPYTSTVRDANGCATTSTSITLTQPSALFFTDLAVTSDYNGSQISCFGASDGSLRVRGNGGITSANYTFELVQTGAVLSANPFGVFGSLPANTYNVRVTDVNGCTAVSSGITLVDPLQLFANSVVTSNYNGSQISCFGISDGQVTISKNGGTPGIFNYQFIEVPGNVTGQTSGIFTGIAAGASYTFRVLDVNNCPAITTPLSITQPIQVVSIASVTSNYTGAQISCFGANDGVVSINSTGGTGAFSYVFNQNIANVTGATSGVFTGISNSPLLTFTVRDINNCTVVTAPIAITQPAAVTAAGLVTSSFNGSQISCFGAADATIQINAANGVGGFTYKIDQLPLNITGNGNGIYTGIASSTYTATVRDANNCFVVTAPIVVSQPTELQISGLVSSNYNGEQISCFGVSDGQITVTRSGGIPAYTFELIETGTIQGGLVFSGLNANSYTFRITDINGCTKISSPIIVSQPSVLSATALVTSNYNGQQISCFNANDAVVTVTRNGGTLGNATFRFVETATNLASASASANFTNVADGGPYTFTVTDINGCLSVATAPLLVTEPPQLVVSASVSSNYKGRDISCFNAKDASITVTSVGGTGVPQYLFVSDPANQTGRFSGVFTTLDAGLNYTFRGTDVNNCQADSNPVTVTQPGAISANTNATSDFNGFDIKCFNETNGELSVENLTGGTAPFGYTLLENPGNLSGTVSGIFTGLRAGTYRVRLSDDNGCLFTTVATPIVQPADLVVKIRKGPGFNGFDTSCETTTDGVILLDGPVTGGAAGYSFTLDQDVLNTTGDVSGTYSNLASGLFSVTVRDVNNCTKTSLPVVLISPLPLFEGVLGFDDAICIGQGDPDAFLELAGAFGGIGNYAFQWQSSPDGNPATFTNIVGANAAIFNEAASLATTTFYRRQITSGTCATLNSNIVKITVNPLPTVVDFSTPISPVCEGNFFIINAEFGIGTAPFFFNYTDNGVPITRVGANVNPIPVFNHTVDRTYILTQVRDFNGCVITPNTSLVVPVSRIDASFTVQDPAPVCDGDQFTFQWNLSPNVEYTWQWPDGSTSFIPSDPSASGSQTITQAFTNPSTTVNSNLPVILVAINNVDGCGPKQTNRAVTVLPKLLLNVFPDKDVICSSDLITFNNPSLAIGSHVWQVFEQGDPVARETRNRGSVTNEAFTIANTSTSPVQNPELYDVVYTVTNGICSQSITTPITVYRKSTADFIADNDSDPLNALGPIVWRIGNAPVFVRNISSPLDASNFSYTWDFDQGATPSTSTSVAPLINVDYAEYGARTIRLSVVNTNPLLPTSLAGCASTKVVTINIILEPLVADFNVTPLANCVPVKLEVNYDGVVTPTGDVFEWEVLDQSGSTVALSSATQPTFDIFNAGTYSVILRNSNSITAQSVFADVNEIKVFANPKAAFQFRPAVVFIPDQELITFNFSEGANLYEWDFGDGTQSFDFEPLHNYRVEGDYPVTLVAGFDNGNFDVDGDGILDGNVICYDTIDGIVKAKDGGITRIPNSFTPSPNGPNGGNAGAGALNDVFLPITKGVEDFLMQIFDRWGNLIFESRDKNQGWDGYDRNSRQMPASVYVYKLELRLSNGQRTTQVGDVTLIR